MDSIVAETALIFVNNIRERRADYYAGRTDPLYCIHGTYIGDWAGPDYLCGRCEDPNPPTDYELALQAARELCEEIKSLLDAAGLLLNKGYIDGATFQKVVKDTVNRLPKDTRPKVGRLP